MCGGGGALRRRRQGDDVEHWTSLCCCSRCGGGGGPLQHTQGMERNREDVREEGGAVNQQQDWVVALQSPRVADKVSDDIVRVLSQGDTPEPDTLAFLEDMVQTLRLER